jgi:hypothetical protein
MKNVQKLSSNVHYDSSKQNQIKPPKGVAESKTLDNTDINPREITRHQYHEKDQKNHYINNQDKYAGRAYPSNSSKSNYHKKYTTAPNTQVVFVKKNPEPDNLKKEVPNKYLYDKYEQKNKCSLSSSEDYHQEPKVNKVPELNEKNFPAQENSINPAEKNIGGVNQTKATHNQVEEHLKKRLEQLKRDIFKSKEKKGEAESKLRQQKLILDTLEKEVEKQGKANDSLFEVNQAFAKENKHLKEQQMTNPTNTEDIGVNDSNLGDTSNLEELQSENSKLIINNDSIKKENANLSAKHANLSDQNKALSSLNDKKGKIIEQLNLKRAQLEKDLGLIKQQIKDLTSENAKLNRAQSLISIDEEIKRLNNKLNEEKNKHAQFLTEYNGVNARFKDLKEPNIQKELAEHITDLNSLRGKLEKYYKEYKSLEKENELLENSINNRRDYSAVYGDEADIAEQTLEGSDENTAIPQFRVPEFISKQQVVSDIMQDLQSLIRLNDGVELIKELESKCAKNLQAPNGGGYAITNASDFNLQCLLRKTSFSFDSHPNGLAQPLNLAENTSIIESTRTSSSDMVIDISEVPILVDYFVLTKKNKEDLTKFREDLTDQLMKTYESLQALEEISFVSNKKSIEQLDSSMLITSKVQVLPGIVAFIIKLNNESTVEHEKGTVSITMVCEGKHPEDENYYYLTKVVR